MGTPLQGRLRRGPARQIAGCVVVVGTGLVLLSILAEAIWLAVPPLGGLAVVLSVGLRRRLRTAAAERERQLRRERDAQTRLRLIAARLEVATELHDTVAHQLVDINTTAGVAVHLGGSAVNQALQDIKRVTAQALADVRVTLGVMPGSGLSAPRGDRRSRLGNPPGPPVDPPSPKSSPSSGKTRRCWAAICGFVASIRRRCSGQRPSRRARPRPEPRQQ